MSFTRSPAFLLVLLTAGSAEVIERDLFGPGDGLLAFDRVNKREWLDLEQSNVAHIEDLLERMVPGGDLEDFEFATIEDMQGLAESAELRWLEPWTLPGKLGQEAQHLVDLIGPTLTGGGGAIGTMRISHGRFATVGSNNEIVFDDRYVYVMSVENPDASFNQPLSQYPYHGGVFISGPF